MISDLPIFRSSVKSAVLSPLISIVTSKVAAKSASVAAGTLLTGLMYLPHNQVAKVITQAIVERLWVPTYGKLIKVAKHPHHHVASAQKLSVPKQELERRLYLHTFEKEYTAVFSGKVTCGDGLCHAAYIQIHISSKQNPHMVKTVAIQPDGSFETSVIFKEYLHENMDWWIVADSPESASKQVQGREILMDDSHISINEPISLL